MLSDPPDPGTVEDRPDDTATCPLCESRAGEGHQPACPLFAPLCPCGARARRYLGEQPCCATCYEKVYILVADIREAAVLCSSLRSPIRSGHGDDKVGAHGDSTDAKGRVRAAAGVSPAGPTELETHETHHTKAVQ